MIVSFKTVVVIAILATIGYFAYTKFYGGLDTEDIGELMEMHRTTGGTRQKLIVHRVEKLYKHDEHYGMMATALDHVHFRTQILAVQVLTTKHERDAMGKLFKMLNDSKRHPAVTVQVVKAFGVMRTKKTPALIKIVERLIELTDSSRPHEVRAAAHSVLKDLLDTGVVKFGTGMRTRWSEVWEDRKTTLKAR